MLTDWEINPDWSIDQIAEKMQPVIDHFNEKYRLDPGDPQRITPEHIPTLFGGDRWIFYKQASQERLKEVFNAVGLQYVPKANANQARD